MYGLICILIGFWSCSILSPSILSPNTLAVRPVPWSLRNVMDSPSCGLLILSPIHKTNPRRQTRFVQNLKKLAYNHTDACIVLLSDEASFSIVKNSTSVLIEARFAFVRIIQDPPFLQQMNLVQPSFGDRHESHFQEHRRSTIAQGRNYLLYSALALVNSPEWVLWLDSDLLSYPANLVERMLATGKQIVVPTCLCAGVGRSSCGDNVYDKNSWAETDVSRGHLKKVPRNVLRVEGYGNDIGRLYMDDLRARAKNGTQLVELQGIGGTCILIRASLHRRGIFFPPFLVNHELETEGNYLRACTRQTPYEHFCYCILL